MVDVVRSDWLKAFFLLLFWWVPPAYFALSAINKKIRSLRGIKDERVYPEETVFLKESYGKWVTKKTSSQLGVIFTWDMTGVISKYLIISRSKIVLTALDLIVVRSIL